MSQIPSGQSVPITFVPDRTAVDAFLAEVRKGYDSSIRFGAGPGGNSGMSATAVAAAGGPATFGNLNGAQVYSSALAGPGIGAFTAGGGGSISGSYGSGGGDLARVASMLQSAASELKSAAMSFRGRGTAFSGGGGREFLNASDVVDDASPAPAEARPSQSGGPSRRGRKLFSLNGIGRYFGAGYLLHEVIGQVDQQINNEHQQELGQMMGSTPAQMAQMRISQYEQLRSGGIFGMNPIIQGSMSWLAKNGINPGGLFTRLPKAEEADAALLNAYEKRDFLAGTTRSEVALRHSMELSGEINPYSRRGMEIRQAGAMRQNEIQQRFTQEELKYNDKNDPDGSYRKSLDKQMGDQLNQSYQASKKESDAFDRDTAMTFRSRAIISATNSAVSGYLQQHDGEGAIYAGLAGRQRAFRETEARDYADTAEGRNARDKAYGAIGAEAGQQIQNMIDTGFTARAGVGAQTESLRAQLNASNPAMGRMQGNILGILRGSEMSAYGTSLRTDINQADKTGLEGQYLNQGQLQLQAFQESIYASGHGQQISSINQQALNGAGSADMGKLNADFKVAVDELKSINGNMGKLHDLLNALIE